MAMPTGWRPFSGVLREWPPEARLVFLGDYVDRGPQSRRVLDRLLSLRRERPDTVFLMGNHEAALLRYDATRNGDDLRFLRGVGFQATLDSYGSPPGFSGLDFMPREHLEFLRGLVLAAHRVVCLFHAPLPWGVDPEPGHGTWNLRCCSPTGPRTALCGRADRPWCSGTSP